MDVLVTGSSGFIGSALLACARSRRSPPDPCDAHVERSRRVSTTWRGIPTPGRSTRGALEGVDAVVHLAGAGIGDRRWDDARKRVIRESRNRATGLLATTIAVARSQAVRRRVGIGDRVLREPRTTSLHRAEPGRATTSSPRCARSGRRPRRRRATAGIRVVTIRTGTCWAGAAACSDRLLPPFRLGLGGRTGSRRPVAVVDLLDRRGRRHPVRARQRRVAGPVNLTAPNPVSNAEFAHTLGRAVHRPAFLPTPLTPLRLVYGARTRRNLLLGGQRVVPERARGERLRRSSTRRSTTRSATNSPGSARLTSPRIGVTEGFRTPDLRDHNPAL